jgi:hypothetical protein
MKTITFQDLEVDKLYKVIHCYLSMRSGIDGAVDVKYVLNVVEAKNINIEYEIVATPHLNNCIEYSTITLPFIFTVKIFKNKKCPVLLCYVEEDEFNPFKKWCKIFRDPITGIEYYNSEKAL